MPITGLKKSRICIASPARFIISEGKPERMNYCPLCNTTDSQASWLGATRYREKKYDYLQCAECDSLYCSPMPDEETLALMYGDDYQQFLSVESCHSGDDGIRQVVEYLKTREKGVFFDYAC